MFKKSLFYFTICTLLLTALPLTAGATTASTQNVLPASVDQVGAYGSINWEQGVVEAIGAGIPSRMAKSPAQARLMARRAAIVNAQRNLLETIEGIKVTAETTVQNLETTSDTVRTRITGIVKGAKIADEQLLADGSYQITLRIDLFGRGGLTEIITDAIKPAAPASLPMPSAAYTPVVLPVYTGLVVDVTGLPVTRALSPVIYDDTGRIIYSYDNLIPEYAVSHGMLDYLCTPEDRRSLELGQSRAGTAPLVVKAAGLRDNNINIIISQAAADKILAANAQDNFLSKAMVCVKQ